VRPTTLVSVLQADPTAIAARASRRLTRASALLDEIDDEMTVDDWLRVRAALGRAFAQFNDELNGLDRRFGLNSAQDRILHFLLSRQGQVVSKEDIDGVAGIQAWARRVRELRQDHGWVIHTIHTMPQLKSGQYVLASSEPDPGLASSWAAARRMRRLRTQGGVLPPKTRVLEFLKTIHPRAAERGQITHVAAKEDEGLRAIEELRHEGWVIEQCAADDLVAPDGWRLVSVRKPD
jgi:hypothetical protein